MVVLKGRHLIETLALTIISIALISIAILCINQGIILQPAGESLLSFILYLIGLTALFTAYWIFLKIKRTIETL